MITYLDPVPDAAAAPGGYDLSVATDAPRVALLANSFPGSVEFLDRLERGLAQHMPKASFARYDKTSMGINASILVPDETLEEIAAAADALVTAYGH